MRVKIVGPVTEARLIEALEKVSQAFDVALGENFSGLFGANLYVQAYTKDGCPVKILDRNGDEKVISLPLTPGQLSKPPKSIEYQKYLAAHQAQEAEERQRHDRLQEQAAAQLREQEERRIQGADKLSALSKQFQAIVSAFGNEAIGDCNAAIKSTWERLNPICTQGKKKGQPRAMPYLGILEGSVYLYAGNRPGDGHKIKTPLAKSAGLTGELIHHWASPEWRDGAVPALAAVIEAYADRLTKK